MAGTSVKAAGRVENRFKYYGKELQHQEFGDGSGLEYYDYGARMYDNQIGRWHIIDPLSFAFSGWSPYVFSFDNPIKYVDPNGMAAGDVVTNSTEFSYRYNGDDSHTVIQKNTSQNISSHQDENGDMIIETTTQTNITEFTFKGPEIKQSGSELNVSFSNVSITETNSIEQSVSKIDTHQENGNPAPIEISHSKSSKTTKVNSIDEISKPYKGEITLKEAALGVQKTMIEKGYQNLIQSKQPDWAKYLKSSTGLFYSGAKWIIKDLCSNPWKGVKGATPATIALNLIDLGVTIYQDLKGHKGETVPLNVHR